MKQVASFFPAQSNLRIPPRLRPTVLATALCILSSSAAAAPIVSGVTGSINHGSTITITGSGFGSKAIAAPVVWDDASTGTYLTDNGKWSGYWPNKGSNLSYVTRYMTPIRGIGLPHNNITRYIAGAHGLANEGYDAGFNVMFWKTANVSAYPFRAYASWYQRLDPAAFPLRSDWNLKYFDWSQGGSPYTMTSCDRNNWYINYAPTNVSLTTTASVQHQMNDDTWGYCSNGSIQNPDLNGHGLYWSSGRNPATTWVKYELEMVITDQSTGRVRVWEDGVQKISYVGRTDRWALGQRAIGIGGYSRDNGPNHWRYFADVYLDYSLQRVVLANNADLASATVVETQVPSSWISSSLSARVNLGRFQTSQTAYLFVFDDSGQRNAVGFPVTIGGQGTGGGQSIPPSPPPGTPQVTPAL